MIDFGERNILKSKLNKISGGKKNTQKLKPNKTNGGEKSIPKSKEKIIYFLRVHIIQLCILLQIQATKPNKQLNIITDIQERTEKF